MQKRFALVAAAVAVLLSTCAFAAPALAATTPPRWLGLYVPGAPNSMAPITAAEAELGTHASVVNFFIADTENFPTTACANVDAAGATPLVTLEFWSTSNSGLATINNGSDDAYLNSFAKAAKSYGKTVWLRPFHEMNGDWYPWGTTGANTPAALIAAYRHVHDIFAEQGATNVKFVWCPNVDYDVASFYPGDAYVDYAAMDGYNNGSPWRSFSEVFGATYDQVAAITPKPIFIAETSCVEGGSGKAAWISDMFDAIAQRYTRIDGVCWFDAPLTSDWRVDTSASSVSALNSGFTSLAYRQIAAPSLLPSSLAIKTNVATAKRRRLVRISGVLRPGRAGSTVRITLSVPRHGQLKRWVTTTSAGTWSLHYTPTVRGKYYLRASFPGDSGRGPVISKTIKLTVK
ncbi:MAG: glycosyl hydrolase [Coriobacteriia bacterium]|nr:glycosyl hydrolase [Coriobacteriia bacterium]